MSAMLTFMKINYLSFSVNRGLCMLSDTAENIFTVLIFCLLSKIRDGKY